MSEPSRTLGHVSTHRLPWLAVALAMVVVTVGCSRTTDISSDDATTTTARHAATTDPLDAQALESGSAAVAKLQGIINSMLASNDTCAILTQKDVPKNQLDPSLLTSSSARKVLSNGLVKVFDHLIQIGPATLQTAFTDEKATFSQVLTVVNQYATDPSSSGATEQINTLVESPGYLAAQSQVTAWVTSNCG
jgi:hypothetical protein